MRSVASAFFAFFAAMSVNAGDLSVAARVEQAMFGDHRSDSNIARNRYRHPVGTLTFLGLEDGMTVMEIWPGSGWYTEILAPVLRGHGQYVAVGFDPDVEGQPDYRYRLQREILEKFAAAPGIYDEVEMITFSPPESASLGDDASVDMVLTFRNTHGWINDGLADLIFAEFARVLKPGGILGVVQHRAPDGARPEESARDGYVSEQAMIDLAREVGLYLEARSEVNANPADSHDHEHGVWTLPPGLEACDDLEGEPGYDECAAPYRAIGESDRMTLRFRKPLG